MSGRPVHASTGTAAPLQLTECECETCSVLGFPQVCPPPTPGPVPPALRAASCPTRKTQPLSFVGSSSPGSCCRGWCFRDVDLVPCGAAQGLWARAPPHRGCEACVDGLSSLPARCPGPLSLGGQAPWSCLQFPNLRQPPHPFPLSVLHASASAAPSLHGQHSFIHSSHY